MRLHLLMISFICCRHFILLAFNLFDRIMHARLLHPCSSHPLADESCLPFKEPVAVPEDQLPLLLPDTDNFKPSGTPESPLAVIDEWVNTVDPASGRPARRETSTMPQVRCS